MKRLILLILFCASAAFGQVARQGQVIAASGRPVAGASIWVCTGNVTVTLTATPPCTPAQNIYTDYAQTQQITQPLLTDGNGNYLYYTQSGTVTEAVTGTGIVGYSAVLTLAPGNAAVKPAASDGFLTVSTLGADSSTCGFSWAATACLTIGQAITNLNASSTGGTIRVGCGTFTVSAQIIISGRIKVIGCGRANASGGNGTLILASNTFPINTAVVGLGANGGGGDEGIRLQDVTVNCNDIAGSIGVKNFSAQEQSGVDHVLTVGCLAEGFDWEGSAAQNSYIHDVEALADAATGASWLGIKVSGTSSFRGIDGATINGSGAGTTPANCMSTADAALYRNIHVEHCTTGILSSGNGETFENIEGGPNQTNVIELASGSQEVLATAIYGSATNLIKNDANSTFTVPSGTGLGWYAVGSGATPPVVAAMTGGTFTFGGSVTLSSTGGGTILHQAPNTASNFTITDPAATGNAVVDSATQTLTNKTLTSPVLNGTPSGTGIATLTLKKGSGGGNYTTASTTYAVVDSANLCYTVTIPTGWKLGIDVNGNLGTSTAVVAASVALTDNAACSTANAGVLSETQVFANAAGNTESFGLTYVITGDGNAHNIALQFKTANASDSALMLNSSSTLLPMMRFTLIPSN